MVNLTQLFCHVDDFWQVFRPFWYQKLLKEGNRQRLRASRLSESEVMTIMILFHQSQYRTFKAFYQQYVCVHLQPEFPGLVSYSRFVRLMKRAGIPLFVYLKACCMGQCTGISFVDATSLAVCHNRRIERHRVFKGLAARGKTSMGWFYGFKLHVIVNEHGDLLDFCLTPGNIDDRKPLPDLLKRIVGQVFGDKGYLSAKLRDALREQGIALITTLRRNMTPTLMTLQERLLLRKRSIIETINDQLKNVSQIEHSRHRSPDNFFVNLMAGLIAYCHQDKKPSVAFDPQQTRLLAIV